MSLPSASVLLRAAQLAIDDDKPVYLDYFRDSLEKKCCVGVQPDNTKYLVKSDSEYTSTIQNIFKCETCYIVATENSLYIVSTDIPVKKIVGSS
jgi:invasion protein IalB